MALKYLKINLSLTLCLPIFLVMIGCQSANTTQKSIDVPKGQTVLKPQTMPRSAIRLKGIVTTEVVIIKDRKMFNLKVEKVTGVGSNYKGREPEANEIVSIDAPSDISTKKGEVVEIDLSASKSKTGDNLMFNLLQMVKK